MSFMRKVLSTRTAFSGDDHIGQTSSDTTLGLTHLKKLFNDFLHPSTKVNKMEQEGKLYNILPLFCKVFECAPASDMMEKWSNVIQFCSHVSRLMVTEIRTRASNQSTEAASKAIVEFMEAESSHENGSGWLLLGTVNLLSSGGHALIDCMTAATLPSTFVKCLYLFFDLPPSENCDTLDAGCQFTHGERLILLQKVFVQVLVRFCTYLSPAEELARKGDLSLLFSAITSWCPPHNTIWRQSAAEVLITLSHHGLSCSVVKYIHDKGCLWNCVDKMRRNQDLSPLELVEMFVTVFCFLKDSSDVSQTLLDDFKVCQGYSFLVDFILRLATDDTEESLQAVRNLLLLVGSLTTCGYAELKPFTSCSLFNLPGFFVPKPSGKGVSVRNVQAFQVLQSVFIKTDANQVCSVVLDILSNIYHQDAANYFILEPQNTLAQFAEKIFSKSLDVQVKYFDLVEYVAFTLNFVPCKELIGLSILIKTQHYLPNSILCMKTLVHILKHDSIYCNVYRELGILEVMVTCLHRYGAHLKEIHSPSPNAGACPTLSTEQQVLGNLVMEALTILLTETNSNAVVFHQCGGARCAHNMVPYPECRQQALCIVQQLMLSPGGEDDMGTLLGLMPTAPVTDLMLKMHILKSLVGVLRESHRSRTIFRKVGGFVYVMSVLVSMEGSLADPPMPPWNTISQEDVLLMLHTLLSSLTIAMRYEPANANFFSTEVRYDSLTEAVRLLGCFSGTADVATEHGDLSSQCLQEAFTDLFSHTNGDRLKYALPKSIVSICIVLRYLFDMSTDAFDRQNSPQLDISWPSNQTSMDDLAVEWRFGFSTQRNHHGNIVHSTSEQPADLSPHFTIDNLESPLLVHPGVILSIFCLLPAIWHRSPKISLELQLFTVQLLKNLLRRERNQQIMCSIGLPHELLCHFSGILEDDAHTLHGPLQRIFERLATQALTPRDLRDFLRLGSPLSCRFEEDVHQHEDSSFCHNLNATGSSSSVVESKYAGHVTESKLPSVGRPVPLTRVKCLVSMTTPGDIRILGVSAMPAFVEFDMAVEGFACLYLPSIAPQGPPTPSVVGGVIGALDPFVIGGIGAGERMFPPQSGLTLSWWFCVDKFSKLGTDSHPVRLLTVMRNIQGRDESMVCLSVFLTPGDHALIVSTTETSMPTSGNEIDLKQELTLSDDTVRFLCPELTEEGLWHHLVLTLHRAGIMKNSSVGLFVDGQHMETQKLHYISPNMGGSGTANPSAPTTVFAYIGSPPQLRRRSRLCWRQGPFYLLEDVLPASIIASVYSLGPTYIGCFQAPVTGEKEPGGAYVSEEKVSLAVHAHVVRQLTVSRVRRVYNKFDSKSIAKQLAMSTHENATPIRILHNSAGHLTGPARSLGAVLIGYLGVQTFCPRPVARMLDNVGGISCLLGLVAMASDVEGMYAAVKALVCVVRSNPNARWDMDRIRGYQLLAMLYKKKASLLNNHILHLTFSLVGSVDSGRETAVIPNRMAFQDLLCDLEVWHKAPCDLHRSLYDHFYELLTDSSESKTNCELMHSIGLVIKMLNVLRDANLSTETAQTIANVIYELLLNGSLEPHSLRRFGQFLVSTISPVHEHCLELESFSSDQITSVDGASSSDSSHAMLSNDALGIPAEDTLGVMAKYSNGVSQCTVVATRVVNQAQISTHHYNVKVRNILLCTVFKLILPAGTLVSQHMCDELQRVLGFDWLMLFLQGHLHQSTVRLALNILFVMLHGQESMRRFRDGTHCGGWLDDTENVLKNQMTVMLGFNIGAGVQGRRHEVNMDVCCVTGFQALQWLLPLHAHIPAVSFMLMKLLMGEWCTNLPDDLELNLDTVWTVVFGVASDKPIMMPLQDHADYNFDAALVILAMIHTLLNQFPENDPQSSSISASHSNVPCVKQYPMTLIHFLIYLYHNMPEFRIYCLSGEFMTSLVASLFPWPDNSDTGGNEEEFKPLPDCEPMVMVRWKGDGGRGDQLVDHPSCMLIVEFLRSLAIDSFTSSTTKLGAVLDVMLEASPCHAARIQQRQFQTTLLSVVMERLLAADVLLGEQAALLIPASTNYAYLATSVFYFASRVVDKLWNGDYTKSSTEVFDFITKLILQSKRKSGTVSLDSIYRSLNRTVLFQLSQPMTAPAGQSTVIDCLHVLVDNRGLVFGSSNQDNDFLACLCFCLLHLTDDPRMTTWHVDMASTADLNSTNRDGRHILHPADLPNTQSHVAESAAPLEGVLRKGLVLAERAAQRVWDELYILRKPALEDIFKTQLNVKSCYSGEIDVPKLDDVRQLILEHAGKAWAAFAEAEHKSAYFPIDRLQNQIQSKLQRMGSGVLRFASRKSKRELSRVSPASRVHMDDFFIWTRNHVDLVKEVDSFHSDQYSLDVKHMERYLLQEWQVVEKELLRERSLWGPMSGCRYQKWLLDMTEGPGRMRKKMVKNDMFYIHYPYRPHLDDSPLRYKVAISFDSKQYYENFHPQGILCQEALPIQHHSLTDLVSCDADDCPPSSPEDIGHVRKLLPQCAHSKLASVEEDEGEESCVLDSERHPVEGGNDTSVDGTTDRYADFHQDGPVLTSSKYDNQTLMRFLGDEEKISHMFRCARIQGLDTVEGLLLFGRDHFYIIDGFTLLRSKEIKDIDSLRYEIHDPIIPMSSMASGGQLKRVFSKFAYDDIREVQKRRYLLQPIAIEVFSGDGRNHLLAFPRMIRNKVFAKFLSMARAITDNADASVSGQRQSAKVESGGGLINSLMGDISVTQRWERGEINNFRYLMHLNTLAGRSYNDLMQYPVFPWIISDYDSPELDMSQPATFRDLGKPMGAQTVDRLEQFRKRYREWDDPYGETPPYHYGTHYSSAMIVASYLVRMEPFTQHFLKLQGGHFDLADRMFHSMRDNWLSASRNNMADVKELIPEFFYLPDFLLNKNNFDLGCKQSGVPLGNVVLPPWAKGDASEFIRVHRQALESDYVSAHLHEWIDLIFGYKQRGPTAVEADNMFHYLFYEGNVDIYSIQDPLKKTATIGFINNFGQIAKQLFKKPHPAKRMSSRLLETLPMCAATGTAADLHLFFHHVDNLRPSMQPIKELKSAVGSIIHVERSVLAVEQNKVFVPPNYSRCLAWGFTDLSVRVGLYELDRAIVVFEGLDNGGEILCAACHNDKVFVTGGTSCVVRVWEYSGRDRRAVLKQPLYAHTEPITCLVTSPAYNIIVSGSRDLTCVIWDMSRLVYVHQLCGHTAPVSAVCVNELTGDIATCAGTSLHLWSVNGETIASIDTGHNQQILCVCMSQFMDWDAQNVILTGGSDGVVRMWSLAFVQIPVEKTDNVVTTAASSTSNKLDGHNGSVSQTILSSSMLGSCSASVSSQPDDVRGMSRQQLSDGFKHKDLSSAAQFVNYGKFHLPVADETLIASSGKLDSPVHAQALCGEPMEPSAHVDGQLMHVVDTDVDNLSNATSSSSGDFSRSGELVPDWDAISGKSLGTVSSDEQLIVLPPEIDTSNMDSSAYSSIISNEYSLEGFNRVMTLTDCVMGNSPPATCSSTDVIPEGEASCRPVDISGNVVAMSHSVLRKGFRWRRQLLFRSKLTMHTAFERRDNDEPAAVTAISISCDHKTVYVGDQRGRIFSWTVIVQPGRVIADHWVKDQGADSCPVCAVRFGFAERRHHCRNCGNVFCSRCSRYETDIQRLRMFKPVRVCLACYNQLRVPDNASGSSKL